MSLEAFWAERQDPAKRGLTEVLIPGIVNTILTVVVHAYQRSG
jgi:hypothetical protein